MKKSVLILCILGFTSLIVGSVMAVTSFLEGNTKTILTFGRIVGSPEESQSEQAGYQTQLDQIGYLTIFASIGFFTVAFLHNRKST